MGVIDINRWLDMIADTTEETLKEKCAAEIEKYNKTKDFDIFIDCIKKESLFFAGVEYERARKYFVKLLNVFQITDIDIDEKLKFIIESSKKKPVRVSDWQFKKYFIL